ncbi:MAG: DUF4250 domain-containing protein [Lachnospiraceae bacterium]
MNQSYKLPTDPMILLSFINMKLRDYYQNLDELCDDIQLDKESLSGKLTEIGYEYNQELNKFV